MRLTLEVGVMSEDLLEDLLPHMANILVAKTTTISNISMVLTLYHKVY